MKKTRKVGVSGLQMFRLEDKCMKICSKMKHLEGAMKKAEEKSKNNYAWRALLNGAMETMNKALADLEERLEHIKMELKEFLAVAWIFFCVGLVCLSGCAHLTEFGKGVWGSSMAHLEKARSSGKAMEVALPYNSCFEESEKILQNAGAIVYLKDANKKYLAAMNFAGYVNTTQVGIFFTKIDDRLTKVEVASLIPELTEQAADLLSTGLNSPS